MTLADNSSSSNRQLSKLAAVNVADVNVADLDGQLAGLKVDGVGSDCGGSQSMRVDCVRVDCVRIAVVGLGYVGLPLALALAREFEGVVGFDVDCGKIEKLRQGIDPCNEGMEEELRETSLTVTSRLEDLRGYNFFIVTVPTPVTRENKPDLSYVIQSSRMVGQVLSKGGVVVFESTVYPGVTEDICGPEIASSSGYVLHEDFKLGYSPERINPGDKEHSLESVVKIVSGEDALTLELVAGVYGKIVKVGVHRAPSIRVAEAAKVVENTQRDLNIALMNELSIIFDRMNVKTSDVLDAASTKWNFNRYTPGLVGGHCIGVDPYYLTSKSEQLGYLPEVILAGRRVNDEMGHFVAQRLVKLMAKRQMEIVNSRVGILGITFKENVSDVRNSRVPSIVLELSQFGCHVMVHDPKADIESVYGEYGVELSTWEELVELDALILAVPHREFFHGEFFSREFSPNKDLSGNLVGILSKFRSRGGVLIDIKCHLRSYEMPQNILYWSL